MHDTSRGPPDPFFWFGARFALPNKLAGLYLSSTSGCECLAVHLPSTFRHLLIGDLIEAHSPQAYRSWNQPDDPSIATTLQSQSSPTGKAAAARVGKWGGAD